MLLLVRVASTSQPITSVSLIASIKGFRAGSSKSLTSLVTASRIAVTLTEPEVISKALVSVLPRPVSTKRTKASRPLSFRACSSVGNLPDLTALVFSSSK